MKCTHPINALVGSAAGVECRACGAVFRSLAELHTKSPEAPAVAEAENPKKKARKKADA